MMTNGLIVPMAAHQYEQRSPHIVDLGATVERIPQSPRPRNRLAAAIAAVVGRWRAATRARRTRRHSSQLPWGL